MPQKPPRAYPDWHRLVPQRFREEVYTGAEEWAFHYNVDWASFLFYCNILHNKDYLLAGGTPEWLSAYFERTEVMPFDCHGQDITLAFHKDKWVTNTLTFHLCDKTTGGGTVYNVTSKIEPSAEFLAGAPAPGRSACPQSVWEAFLIAYFHHHFGGDGWEPK